MSAGPLTPPTPITFYIIVLKILIIIKAIIFIASNNNNNNIAGRRGYTRCNFWSGGVHRFIVPRKCPVWEFLRQILRSMVRSLQGTSPSYKNNQCSLLRRLFHLGLTQSAISSFFHFTFTFYSLIFLSRLSLFNSFCSSHLILRLLLPLTPLHPFGILLLFFPDFNLSIRSNHLKRLRSICSFKLLPLLYLSRNPTY